MNFGLQVLLYILYIQLISYVAINLRLFQQIKFVNLYRTEAVRIQMANLFPFNLVETKAATELPQKFRTNLRLFDKLLSKTVFGTGRLNPNPPSLC